MYLRTLAAALLLSTVVFAQEPKPDPNAPLSSPLAHASVQLGGKQVAIRYNAPSMRGRKIMGGLVPYGEAWRTGANDATSLVTPVALTIGNLTVPAGSYTIYTLPSAGQWLLIINKQTKQWGTEYHQEQDLGRTPMQHVTLPRPQEVMSISFDHRSPDGKSAELHVRWENTDEWVKISAK